MQLLPKDPLQLSTQFRVGRGVKRVYTDKDRHLIFEMTDGQEIDIGVVEGEKGETGPQGPQGEQGPAGATGPSGSPGIVISDTQPTDPNHPVWLDPDGDASTIPWVPQPATAAVGQIVKVKAVDSEGHITEVEAADMPSGGGGAETWELIKEIVIPEGAEESNSLTINQDSNGQPFQLLKARLCAKFPKYTGSSTIPRFSFAVINGRSSGSPRPLAYTSAWSTPSATTITGTVYEVDVSGAQQVEMSLRSPTGGWPIGGAYEVYGNVNNTTGKWYADTLWAKPITSIGGAGMLIYPGCIFRLYGVRA